MVKDGPKLVTIKSAPKWVKNNSLCVIELGVDGVKHVYFTKNELVAAAFKPHIGKQVVLIASGNDRQNTDSMEVQPAGVPASALANAPKAPQLRENAPSKPEMPKPIHGDTEVKRHLCQAANLMRLCVKKANDIAIELGLSPEHRQGIATSLFIQSDRMGYIKDMPITPYSAEQLGFGASKSTDLANPQPEEAGQ